jgi:WD40-like Beta Propeller Repeat
LEQLQVSAPVAPVAAFVLALVCVAAVASAGSPSSSATAASGVCPRGAAPLGRVAFVRGRALVVLDLDRCSEHTLVRGLKAPVEVAWSADGNWIAVGNTVVAASNGRVARPFGRLRAGEGVGVWAPRGHLLAHVTARGGLLLGGPGLRPRRLLRDGWGVSDVMYAADGRLAVARDLRFGSGVGRPQRQEIWLLRPPTLRPRLLYRVPSGRDTPPRLAAVSKRGGAVFFWPSVDHANSANLDGLPLELVTAPGRKPTEIVHWMLARPDFFSWCGSRLIAVAGFDRMATVHKSLVSLAPPLWQKRILEPAGPLSWITPSCAPNGRKVAAAAGPNREDIPFGREARAIRIVSIGGGATTVLARPPRGESDELPRWSHDGRFILFVRGGPTNKDAAAPGHVYLVETAGKHRVYGPLASLGLGGNYYGQYGWNWDWYQPPAR